MKLRDSSSDSDGIFEFEPDVDFIEYNKPDFDYFSIKKSILLNDIPSLKELLSRIDVATSTNQILEFALDQTQNLDLFRIMIDHGADINQGFAYAIVHKCNESVLTFFVDQGADINGTIGISGETPLHKAIQHDTSPNVIRYLLRKGADPLLKSIHNCSPVDLIFLGLNIDKEIICALLEHPDVFLNHYLNYSIQLNNTQISLEAWVELEGGPLLKAKFRYAQRKSNQIQCYDRNRNIVALLPPSRTFPHWLETYIRNFQLIFSRRFAMARLREIELLPTPSSPSQFVFNESDFAPTLSPFIKRLLAHIATAPYYMKHATLDPVGYNKMMRSGALRPFHRLQNAYDTTPYGLIGDLAICHNSHYFVFGGLGINPDTILAHSYFNDSEAGSVLFSLDNMDEITREFLVVKSTGWGSARGEDRMIPLSKEASVHVTYDNQFHPQKGHHTKESKQTYTYFEKESHPHLTYTLSIKDEVTTGLRYKDFLASLYRKHLKMLPLEQQKYLLSPFINAGDNLPEIRKTIESFIQHYHILEASIASTLPLDVAYVDQIKMPGKTQPVISLVALRQAIIAGDTHRVHRFFEIYPEIKSYPWVVEGVIRLATRYNHVEMLDYANHLMMPPPSVNILSKKEIAIIEDIIHFQALILETEPTSNLLSVHYKDHLLTLEFNMSHHGSSRGRHVHAAATLQLFRALGNQSIVNSTDYRHLNSLPDPFYITLNGKANESNIYQHHPAYSNLTSVLNALIKYELITLLTSAHNLEYYLKYGQLNNPTGYGASSVKVGLLNHRLETMDISVCCEDSSSCILVQAIVQDKDDSSPALFPHLVWIKHHIQSVLAIHDHPSWSIDETNGILTIPLSASALANQLRSRKINYQGVIPTDAKGNILFAERMNQGLKTAGGHNSNNYHPELGALIELKSEFSLILKNPDNLCKFQRIATVGPFSHKDIAVFHISTRWLQPIGAAKRSPVGFKVDPDEFVPFSERCLSHVAMIGREFSHEMTLEAFIRYEQRLLQASLDKHENLRGITVDIESKCSTGQHSAYGTPVKIPGSHFGNITFHLPKERTHATRVTLQELFSKHVYTIINAGQMVKIHHVNPLLIVDILETHLHRNVVSSSALTTHSVPKSNKDTNQNHVI
ncbi:MAG: ankyrin repeat domain-containing protein [Alphaproteobacteria bacterium]|nr:ankyrin repeat domain-containing protein [Alphaproteobacteria bacterium]